MSDIEVERKGEVEWIRLNRPDRMNAYDAEMARELIAAIENASDAGVIVLPGGDHRCRPTLSDEHVAEHQRAEENSEERQRRPVDRL